MDAPPAGVDQAGAAAAGVAEELKPGNAGQAGLRVEEGPAELGERAGQRDGQAFPDVAGGAAQRERAAVGGCEIQAPGGEGGGGGGGEEGEEDGGLHFSWLGWLGGWGGGFKAFGLWCLLVCLMRKLMLVVESNLVMSRISSSFYLDGVLLRTTFGTVEIFKPSHNTRMTAQQPTVPCRILEHNHRPTSRSTNPVVGGSLLRDLEAQREINSVDTYGMSNIGGRQPFA
jgi:hypothetical protein